MITSLPLDDLFHRLVDRHDRLAKGGHGDYAGSKGYAAAGDDGILLLPWHDGSRWRYLAAYVGENGIEKNIYYRAENGGAVCIGPVAEVDRREKRDRCAGCLLSRDAIETYGHGLHDGKPCESRLSE